MQEGFPPVFKRRVAVEKLAEQMDGVDHRDGHQENGDHGTHDVNRVSHPDQQAHGADHRHPGHDHGRQDQQETAEEDPHDDENNQSRQGSGEGHLFEHFHAEGVFRHRQAGYIKLFGAFELAEVIPDPGSDLVTQGFFPDWDIEAERFAVLRDQGAVQHGVFPRPVAYAQGRFPGFRRGGHQPFETHRSQAGLFDIVDLGGGQ